MYMINTNLKTDVFYQLKQNNHQFKAYNGIIESYNRILEENSGLRVKCGKFEKEILELRSRNVDLEKIFNQHQKCMILNDELKASKDEIVTHLREKDEFAREVIQLTRTVKELNKKCDEEANRAQQYSNEIVEMERKLKQTEYHLNELTATNNVIGEEYHSLQNSLNRLQNEYNQLKPTCLELEQQLDMTKRENQQIENQLVSCKNQIAAMHDYENAKFRMKIGKQDELINGPKSNEFMDDIVIISSTDSHSDFPDDTLVNSSLDTSFHQRTDSVNSSTHQRKDVFTNMIRKLAQGITNNTNEKLYRTPKSCTSSFVPTQMVAHWDCTELEAYALAFQPSGSILATGCSDKSIHLWEIASNGQQSRYCSLQGSHGAINALDFDKEGFQLLAACSTDKAYIWSYGDQKVLKDTYAGHQSTIYTCKFISGIKLATGSGDRTIRIWDLRSRNCIQTLFAGSKCHDLVIKDAAGTIISGHFDRKIRIWEPCADKHRHEMEFDESITSLAYNEDKQLLLACFKNDKIRLIDLRQNKTLCTFSHDNFQVSTCTTKAIFSPDGRYASAGSHNGSIVVWNVENYNCETTLKNKHTTMVTGIAWHPDGRFVASCEKQRRVIIWSN